MAFLVIVMQLLLGKKLKKNKNSTIVC